MAEGHEAGGHATRLAVRSILSISSPPSNHHHLSIITMLKFTNISTLPRLARPPAGLVLGMRHKTTVEAMKDTAEKVSSASSFSPSFSLHHSTRLTTWYLPFRHQVNKETGKVLAEALGKAEKVVSTTRFSHAPFAFR